MARAKPKPNPPPALPDNICSELCDLICAVTGLCVACSCSSATQKSKGVNLDGSPLAPGVTMSVVAPPTADVADWSAPQG